MFFLAAVGPIELLPGSSKNNFGSGFFEEVASLKELKLF
jgi:hypothetical protein